jgi:hypothetical protein
MFYLGGIEVGRAWIETYNILEYYKESETYYYFNLICNSEKGDRLQNGQLLYIDKNTFNQLDIKL